MQHVERLRAAPLSFRICSRQPTALRWSGARVETPSGVSGWHYGSGERRICSVTRRTQFWAPTGGIESSSAMRDDTHALLVRAGYLRQTHPGVFHMLPLGNRVQHKIERLIDKHMTSIGASKTSLSSITSERLWEDSGRLAGHRSDLFKVEGRREANLLLSPTHEEEITALIANVGMTPKDLPLRLYQISRKYRDEQRPRQGLLRGREFVMKDLYTFDRNETEASETYDQVRRAYDAFMNEFKLPFMTAKADSGSMGGQLSHEYHFVSPKGEDILIHCEKCNHTMNDELAISEYDSGVSYDDETSGVVSWWAVSRDRNTLIRVMYPHYQFFPSSTGAERQDRVTNSVSVSAVKAALPDVDLDAGVLDARGVWKGGFDQMQITLVDPRLRARRVPAESHHVVHDIRRARVDGKQILLTKTLPGEQCTNCQKPGVQILPAIEIGHTFNLGTRYSKPLKATVMGAERATPLEMGCHGIGVSRMLGAIASIMADEKGLNWPAVIAPFSIAVLQGKDMEQGAKDVCSSLSSTLSSQSPDEELDILWDDRPKKTGLGWKLNDADLIGYPIIVVVGSSYTEDGTVEVQCRRLGFKAQVATSALADTIRGQLSQL